MDLGEISWNLSVSRRCSQTVLKVFERRLSHIYVRNSICVKSSAFVKGMFLKPWPGRGWDNTTTKQILLIGIVAVFCTQFWNVKGCFSAFYQIPYFLFRNYQLSSFEVNIFKFNSMHMKQFSQNLWHLLKMAPELPLPVVLDFLICSALSTEE